jgi:hypothetical protein
MQGGWAQVKGDRPGSGAAGFAAALLTIILCDRFNKQAKLF